MNGTTYTDFEALWRSIRQNSIVRVFSPYLLGGAAGSTRKRRSVWADRADRIKGKEKGVKLVSIDPPLSGHKLTMTAYEQIGNVARGKAGKPKSGRPTKSYTEKEMTAITHWWPPRKGMTTEASVDKINELIAPRKVTRGWLYVNVK